MPLKAQHFLNLTSLLLVKNVWLVFIEQVGSLMLSPVAWQIHFAVTVGRLAGKSVAFLHLWSSVHTHRILFSKAERDAFEFGMSKESFRSPALHNAFFASALGCLAGTGGGS